MNRLPNAGGRTSTPSLRKLQAPTSSPSRLRAVSHRMVASEPVTERFGPTSTPTRIALVTRSGVGDLRGAPGNETCGQIVHQVAGKGVEDPGSPGRLGFRLFGRRAQHIAERADEAGLAERLDQHEQTGDKRQCALGDAVQHALALISHLTDGACGHISEKPLMRALAFAEYLETHARRVTFYSA
jgi:hypothetical protein